MKRPLADRFVEKIKINLDSGCWEWTSSKVQNGYGNIWVGDPDRRCAMAHRVAYELLVGPIPEGMTLDHLCRVRHCVNPAHLEPVTNRENLLRGEGFSAVNARKTHCKRGHEFNERNAYYRTKRRGGFERDCKLCKDIRRKGEPA